MLFWIISLCIFIGAILPYVAQWILRYTFKASESEVKLREEYNELRKELRSISAVDEFAKFARTQRKLNQVKEQLSNAGVGRLDTMESLKWKLTKSIQALNGAILLYIVYEYRYQPVLEDLPDWFWPLNNVLSYPTGVTGALSTVVWLIVCNKAIRSLVK